MGYTLEDLYVIFQQEEDRETKQELLRLWAGLNLGFNINWGGLLKAWG